MDTQELKKRIAEVFEVPVEMLDDPLFAAVKKMREEERERVWAEMQARMQELADWLGMCWEEERE